VSRSYYISNIPPSTEIHETKGENIPSNDEEHLHVDMVLDGKIVGKRIFNENGILIFEEPLKDDHVNGTKFGWNDDGSLEFLEPYFEGRVHGTALQFDPSGNVVGMYTMVHGTGFDIWRQPDEKGIWRVAEIHSWENGCVHGYERWLKTDGSLWHERHWHNGEWHGIERMWNDKGNLRRGYPQYWIGHEKTSKWRYLKACHEDPNLPPYNREDDLPKRIFPAGIDLNPFDPKSSEN
jgi:hypothetical protein